MATIELKAKVMAAHCIEHTLQDGQLFVLDVGLMQNGSLRCEWKDATDWTLSEVKAWLGY